MELRKNVSDSWWNSCGSSGDSGNHLHLGKNNSINFEQNKNWFFGLQQLVDVTDPELYSMRHNAVLAYTDNHSLLYCRFKLPALFLSNPANEPASTSSKNCKQYNLHGSDELDCSKR